MAELDFREKLNQDLLEQFRGKKNIAVVANSYAKQLQEVHDFLESLLQLLDIDACTGAQLDIIGDIVVLSRYDARVIVERSYDGEALDDDLYRKLIKWKILLNTNDCTYWSIMKGIKMFWDKTPVYYKTDPEIPATILLSTPPLDPSTNPRELLEMPIIRPGGVDLKLTATTENPAMEGEVYVGGAMFQGIISTQLSEIQIDYNLREEVKIVPAIWSAMQTVLPEIKSE
jgi:hypothetical protein